MHFPVVGRDSSLVEMTFNMANAQTSTPVKERSHVQRHLCERCGSFFKSRSGMENFIATEISKDLIDLVLIKTAVRLVVSTLVYKFHITFLKNKP